MFKRSPSRQPLKPSRPSDAEKSIIEYLKDFSSNKEQLTEILPLARETLDRVTALTEYEDAKAGRILTGIALLSAGAGTVYSGMKREYLIGLWDWEQWVFHLGFAFYAVTTAISVLVLLRAIYPWFHLDDYLKKPSKKGAVRSVLFAPLIAKAFPEDWANVFKQDTTVLQRQYLTNYIHESFLIAGKVEIKFKRLRNALQFIVPSLAVLLLWLAFCGYLNLKTQRLDPSKVSAIRDKDLADYSCLVVFDADNTLWDTNLLFAEAQVGLLDDLRLATGFPAVPEPLEFIRNIDQNIAANHSDNLRYPPELLAAEVLKTLLNLLGRTDDSIQDKDVILQRARDRYLAKIGEVPHLRAGVQEGLKRLRQLGARIVVCSEGHNDTCLRNLNELDVLGLIDCVRIVRKSPDVFRALSDQFNPYRKPQFSVGDQLDRDIQFAKLAGYKTAYFPSEFRPKWLRETVTVSPDITIDSIAVLPVQMQKLITLAPLADDSSKTR